MFRQLSVGQINY
jgi:hypothetical protein